MCSGAQDLPETLFLWPHLSSLHPSHRLTCRCRGRGRGAGRRGLRGAAALSHQAWGAAVVLPLDEQLGRAGQRDGVADAQFLLLGLLPSQGHLEAQGSGSPSSTPESLSTALPKPRKPHPPQGEA